MRKLPAILLAAAVLAFFAARITSSDASIHWDAADEFQPFQNYISQELHAGRIPFWTSHLWAGYPALEDPQAGAWYPLNWPFFLAGITPRAIQLEIALHAFLACLGAFLLLARFVPRRPAALTFAPG